MAHWRDEEIAEQDLLQAIARKPDDRALRAVYADWLQEQGDPRGEVIALCTRGNLSLSERRRVQRLTEENAPRWLGPLAAAVDLGRSRWADGFPVAVTFRARDLIPWDSVRGDPRWATVKSLIFPPTANPDGLRTFFADPVMANVERIEAGVAVLLQLRGAERVSFVLQAVGVASWGTFEDELVALSAVRELSCVPCGRRTMVVKGACVACGQVLELDSMTSARRLDLATSEFVNPLVAREIREVISRTSAPMAYQELRLLAPFGVMEGVAAWLGPGVARPQIEAWSVEFGDVLFRLRRFEREFRHLTVDLSGPSGTFGLGQRLATVVGVLVLLRAALLTDLEVRLPEGARLRPAERDSLRSAVRRLGTIRRFSLGGQAVTP